MIEKFEYLQNTVTLKIGYVNSIKIWKASNFQNKNLVIFYCKKWFINLSECG